MQADSIVSDITQQGYCDDDKSPSVISMKLEPVNKKSIKDLFINTEKVSHFIFSETLPLIKIKILGDVPKFVPQMVDR